MRAEIMKEAAAAWLSQQEEEKKEDEYVDEGKDVEKKKRCTANVLINELQTTTNSIFFMLHQK